MNKKRHEYIFLNFWAVNWPETGTNHRNERVNQFSLVVIFPGASTLRIYLVFFSDLWPLITESSHSIFGKCSVLPKRFRSQSGTDLRSVTPPGSNLFCAVLLEGNSLQIHRARQESGEVSEKQLAVARQKQAGANTWANGSVSQPSVDSVSAFRRWREFIKANRKETQS